MNEKTKFIYTIQNNGSKTSKVNKLYKTENEQIKSESNPHPCKKRL